MIKQQGFSEYRYNTHKTLDVLKERVDSEYKHGETERWYGILTEDDFLEIRTDAGRIYNASSSEYVQAPGIRETFSWEDFADLYEKSVKLRILYTDSIMKSSGYTQVPGIMQTYEYKDQLLLLSRRGSILTGSVADDSFHRILNIDQHPIGLQDPTGIKKSRNIGSISFEQNETGFDNSRTILGWMGDKDSVDLMSIRIHLRSAYSEIAWFVFDRSSKRKTKSRFF
jgi:hypothetical protein